MSKLREYLEEHGPQRDPPYRPFMGVDDEERAVIAEKLGSAENYASDVLQRMILADPDNKEYKRALTSSIVSAEYAGIDAFGGNVARWEEQELPDYLLMAMVRQTWDEVRHARLGTELLELEYDGTLGEYPDTLAGSGGRGAGARRQAMTEQDRGRQRMFGGPVQSLSAINVGVEGRALLLFSGVSKLGAKIGDAAMEQAYDYNWADEVLHVAIGDYFVKKIAEQQPEQEKVALMAQAATEAGPFGQQGQQQAQQHGHGQGHGQRQPQQQQRRGGAGVLKEVVEFLKEEMDAAESVLVGPLSPSLDSEEPDATSGQ